MNWFLIPEAALFRAAWAKYYSDRALICRDELASEIDLLAIWRKHHWKLYQNWNAFMQAVHRHFDDVDADNDTPNVWPKVWNLFALMVHEWFMVRERWMRPGGFLMTRAGNLRKKKPPYHVRRPNLTALRWKIRRVEKQYQETLKAEPEFEGNLLVAVLALSGAIYSGKALAEAVSIAHSRAHESGVAALLRGPRGGWWPRTVGARLRGLRRAGLLTQPDWRR